MIKLLLNTLDETIQMIKIIGEQYLYELKETLKKIMI